METAYRFTIRGFSHCDVQDQLDGFFATAKGRFFWVVGKFTAADPEALGVFAGEYACHGKGKKWNHYEASILEAAFMTDMERNADVVYMTAYAPRLREFCRNRRLRER